jgi:ethanolamine transporter EutH
MLPAVIVGKLTGGVTAVALAIWMTGSKKGKTGE